MDRELLDEKARNFLAVARKIMANVGPGATFNADHSGINYKFHSGRTDDFVGVRHVKALCQSKNPMSHSPTYFPMVSAGGDLQEHFMIITQEPKGEFGVRVQENVLRPPNDYVVPSKSGKMTKEILHDWTKFVYFNSIQQHAASFLLVDSWSAFKDIDGTERNVPVGHEFIPKLIPEGTTPLVQTLDVYGFQKNSVTRLVSVTHKQFQSPRFQNMWKYSWYKAGYFDERPPEFQTPTQYCFDVTVGCESCAQCAELAFIRCGWCKTVLCFSHFWFRSDDYLHLCSQFVE